MTATVDAAIDATAPSHDGTTTPQKSVGTGSMSAL